MHYLAWYGIIIRTIIIWPGLPFYSAWWNIIVWAYRPSTRTMVLRVACWSGGKKKRKLKKEKAQTWRSPELMVHLSLSEPLTGSSLSRGKTRVKRWGVNPGVTAYISLALQPACPVLCPAEGQLPPCDFSCYTLYFNESTCSAFTL